MSSSGMEPAEKAARQLVKLGLVVFAFIIAIVFGEFYRGMGWFGLLIFVIGAAMGALGIYLWKHLSIGWTRQNAIATRKQATIASKGQITHLVRSGAYWVYGPEISCCSRAMEK